MRPADTENDSVCGRDSTTWTDRPSPKRSRAQRLQYSCQVALSSSSPLPPLTARGPVTPATSKNHVLAINQPYFFPYLGYFSLIAYSDLFVLYDDVEYSKQSWTNRNRILRNGEVIKISLPLRAAPDSTWISKREIAPEFTIQKLYRIVEGAYRKAPYWNQLQGIIESMEVPQSRGLFDFLYQNISNLCDVLGIGTPILRYSDVAPESTSSIGEERIFSVAKALAFNRYVNLPGGQKLYSRLRFAERNLDLEFLEHIPRDYPQLRPQFDQPNGSLFVDRLSILDSIANIGVAETSKRIHTDFRIM